MLQGNLIHLTFAALVSVCNPTSIDLRTYVDPTRMEDHVFEHFADLGVDSCPVQVVCVTDSEKKTEITVIPSCAAVIGSPILRFIEESDGNFCTFTLENNGFRLHSWRFRPCN